MPDDNIIGGNSLEQATALKNLMERERELSDFIENAPVGLHCVASDGTILWANQAELELLGYAREEYVGRSITEFHADPEVIDDILQRLAKDETLNNYEARLCCKDGSVRYVLISSNVLRENGEFVHTRCFTRDITERKKNEESLRDNEERFRAVAESASDAIITINEDSTLVFLNPATEEIFGYEPGELLGKQLTVLMPEYQRHVHQTGIKRYIETGKKHINWKAVELPGLHKDGHEISLEISFSEFTSKGKHHFTGIVRDISERRSVEAALVERTRLAEFNAAISFALTRNDGLDNILHQCAAAIVEYFDAAFARIWTLVSKENVLKLRASAGLYTHLDGRHGRIPVGKFKIGQIAQTRQPHLTNQVVGDPTVSDQEWAKREGMIAFAGYPLIIEDRLVGVVAMFARKSLDEVMFKGMEAAANAIALGIERKRVEEEREYLLTSEREARQTAENASRLKDEFLATVSHELRTPLTSMLGWTNLLRKGSLDEQAKLKALEIIERNGQSQNRLIEDLLDVSRIISGKIRLEVQAVDLGMIINAVVETVRPAATAKDIKLQVLLDTQAGLISGDPDRLQQVVWNLLSNAIKFTPRGGRVQIRLERVNSHVEIIVSDTGKGIEAEFQPFAFDRFSQADQKITRKYGGLGLGLSIVKHFIELHGGTAHVESKGENTGTTFIVKLPLLPLRVPVDDTDPERAHPTARTVAEFDDTQNLNGLRILVVDDEPDARDLLYIVLQNYGAKVTTADSAAEALEKLKCERPDVLVCDIGMPDEDGYSLLRKIRGLSADEGGKVPAVALTAYARAADRVRALRAGYQIHVPKPVEPGELIAVIASLVGRNHI
ncbi:MAG: ATP-binding protein [Pyrinomonadaceae bacterium]